MSGQLVTLVVAGAVGWLVLAVAVGLLVARTIARRERQRPVDGPPEATVDIGDPQPGRPSTPSRVVLLGAAHDPPIHLDLLAVLAASSFADIVMIITCGRMGGRTGSAVPPVAAIDLARAARTMHAPTAAFEGFDRPEVVTSLRAVAPDLLVAGWTRSISAELLAVPRRGCVGFDLRLAANARSRSAISWAILRGEPQIENVMLMLDPDEGGGDVVDRRVVQIKPDDTHATVSRRLAAAGAEMLERNLVGLATGTAPRARQGQAGVVLPTLMPQMGILDWRRPAVALNDWVRALTWPGCGAYTVQADQTIMLWSAHLPIGHARAGPPGTILALEPDGLHVATGRGTLVVTEMSGRGEARHPAVPWSSAAGLGPGVRFDSVPPSPQWPLGPGPGATSLPFDAKPTGAF